LRENVCAATGAVLRDDARGCIRREIPWTIEEEISLEEEESSEGFPLILEFTLFPWLGTKQKPCFT